MRVRSDEHDHPRIKNGTTHVGRSSLSVRDLMTSCGRRAPYEIRRDKALRACEAWAEDESLAPNQRNIAWRIRGQWKWLDRDERLAVLKAFTGKVGCLESIDKLIW